MAAADEVVEHNASAFPKVLAVLMSESPVLTFEDGTPGALANDRLLRQYVGISALLNLALLGVGLHRLSHAASAMDHAMARVLLWAVAVNLGGTLMLWWLASRQHWQAQVRPVLKFDVLTSLLPFVMVPFLNGQSGRKFHLYGAVYTAFLLLKLGLRFYYATVNAPGFQRARRMPLFVFLSTFLVYGGLVPWMALASAPQGDEAPFMLLTHSLIFDHDFDVGDNYRNGDYKEMFPPPSPGGMRGYPYASTQRDNLEYIPLEPHVVTNYRGQLMLEHDMGLPLLLLPGYALDLREGALFTMALLAALGTSAIFEMCLLLGASNLQALLTVALFCFTTPYWVFSQSALGDLPGAVTILWTGLQFFRYRERERERYLLLAGILIAILPWLNIRFWSLAGPEFLVLGAWVIRREWGNWRSLIEKMGLLGIPSLISLGVFAAVDKALFNTYKPNASMLLLGRVWPQFQFHPIRGFLGMLFDQSYGLVPTAPLFVAVAAGMVVLFRRDRWGFVAMLAPAAGYVPFVSCGINWFGGWSAPGRYMLSATILMIPAVTLVLNQRVRWLVGLLAAWSFFISVAFTINPYLRMPSIWTLYQISMLVEFFHDHIHTPFYSILSVFPNLVRGWGRDYLRGWLWLIAFSATAWWWARTAGQPRPAKRS